MTVERRTIIKGAAWSVPVIAAAVATPLATASTPTEEGAGFRFNGNAWNNGKNPVEFSIHNDTKVAGSATVVVEWDGGSDTVNYTVAVQEGHFSYQLPEGVEKATFSVVPASTKHPDKTTFVWTAR